MVGGLVVSQLLTLYITPVYFIYLEHFKNWVTGRKAEKGATLSP